MRRRVIRSPESRDWLAGVGIRRGLDADRGCASQHRQSNASRTTPVLQAIVYHPAIPALLSFDIQIPIFFSVVMGSS